MFNNRDKTLAQKKKPRESLCRWEGMSHKRVRRIICLLEVGQLWKHACV